jgi:hypothetical protein
METELTEFSELNLRFQFCQSGQSELTRAKRFFNVDEAA